MRTRNSFLNFLANTGSHILNIILSFVCRTIFIYTLSQEYLGVNGLFGNILTVLSLAELGIGGAMTFHLYKPIAQGDEKEIRELMNLYRVLYTIVATFVGVAGLILVPFLQYFIAGETTIPMDMLRLIYVLYLINTVCSYLWGYKRAIIDGHQKAYVGTIYNTIFTTIQFVSQIVVLLLFENFIIYLLIQIFCSIATNIAVARKADRMYSYLKADRKSMPSKDTRKSIAKNVGAMSLHKLGDVVVNNTDNLIMSAFVGLVSVGIYSNYQMIQAVINTALNGLFGAFTASIGNLGASENRKRMFEVYRSLLFLGFWLYGFATVAFLVLFNPFLTAWAGENYIFPMGIVLVYEINFYIAGMRKVTITFRDAMGLYWYDRYKPLFEVVINLVASLVLVIHFGIIGILLGTVISTMTTCFWIEPLVTYKYGFKEKVRHYFGMFTIYTLTVIGVGGFVYWLASFVTMGGFLEVFIKLLIVISVYNSIILLMYCRTKEFKMIWNQGMVLYQNIKERRKQKEQE